MTSVRTFMPGRACCSPSTITAWPGVKPASMIRSPFQVSSGWTGRVATVPASSTMETIGPAWVSTTASSGTTTTSRYWPMVVRTSTYWPGSNSCCGLGTTAFNRNVPVVGSTVLSRKVTVPS